MSKATQAAGLHNICFHGMNQSSSLHRDDWDENGFLSLPPTDIGLGATQRHFLAQLMGGWGGGFSYPIQDVHNQHRAPTT